VQKTRPGGRSKRRSEAMVKRMLELKPCPECKVPEYISREHSWLDNGDIVQSREEWHRMLFIETAGIDPLFRGIEEIVGESIEHIVITAQRRAVRMYLSQFISEETRELVKTKRVPLKPLAEAIGDIARLTGYGDYRYIDMRYELDDDDYYTVSIKEPFSLPMAVASFMATIEMLTGRDLGATYRETSPGEYSITVFPSEHPQELREKMWLRYYYPVKGDCELDKCRSCGAPLGLSEYRWDPERGVIEGIPSGRRMIIIGWQNLEPIFNQLEAEGGSQVMRAVIEAQRRFTADGFYHQDIRDLSAMRKELAIRGLGNLKKLDFGMEGLHVLMENAVFAPVMVGLFQGLHDMHSGSGSQVEWRYSEEGALEVWVSPA